MDEKEPLAKALRKSTTTTTYQPKTYVFPQQSDVYTTPINTLLWRLPLYAIAAVDFFTSVLFVIVFFVWIQPGFGIPEVFLFLFLFQVPHLFLAAGLLGVLYDTINFFYINMIAVIAGITLIGDFIALVWRSVCLANPGILGCTLLPAGKWLEWMVWALVVVFMADSFIALGALVIYIRLMKRNIQDYFRRLEEYKLANPSFNAKAQFQQSLPVYNARSVLRGLGGLDFVTYAFIIIIRVALFFGLGYWFSPFLQVLHTFIWTWTLEIGGSPEIKTPLSAGGSDASTSEPLILFTFYTTLVAIFADITVLVLTCIETGMDFFGTTILATSFAFILIFLNIVLLAYDIAALTSLNSLSSIIAKFVSQKLKQ